MHDQLLLVLLCYGSSSLHNLTMEPELLNYITCLGHNCTDEDRLVSSSLTMMPA